MKKVKGFLYDLIDFSIAAILFNYTAPLFLLTIFLVKIDSPGSVFYTQIRYGKNKKTFKIYKFRTMKQNSEPESPVWGKEDDPRASRIGKFLRIYHLDELPQLINVLKGEMSIVGPRPERPYFADRFAQTISNYEQRHQVKPGITGWSQINGLRANSCVVKRTDYDYFYIKNRTLKFYFKILLATPLAKPVQQQKDHSLASYYTLTFSQIEEDLEGSMPLATPIKNA